VDSGSDEDRVNIVSRQGKKLDQARARCSVEISGRCDGHRPACHSNLRVGFHRFKKSLVIATIAAAAITLGDCSATEADAGANASGLPAELVLGLVPSHDVDKLVIDAEVLGELLAAELDIPVSAIVTASYAALVVAMQAEQAHIGMFGPIALVQAIDQADAVAALQSVRYGSSTYVAQWYTNDPDWFCETDVVTSADGFTFCNGTDTAESGPVGVESLAKITQDEAIAFVDEGSASGYYYPAT